MGERAREGEVYWTGFVAKASNIKAEIENTDRKANSFVLGGSVFCVCVWVAGFVCKKKRKIVGRTKEKDYNQENVKRKQGSHGKNDE